MKRTTSIGMWWAALAAGILAAPAPADQILQVSGETVTNYKGIASTLQKVYPLVQQRGAFVDGTLSGASVQGWSLAANPFGEAWDRTGRMGSLRLDTLTYSPTEVDLSFPAQVPWVIGRSYNHRQESSGGTHVDSDGPQGFNWFQMSLPEIATYVNSGDHTKDMVYIVYGADRFLEFSRTSSSSTEYRGINGCAGIVKYISGTPDVYVYYDQRGYQTYFFGGNANVVVGAVTTHAAKNQIWKIVDPDGKIAYVGDDTTASTAVTNGTDGHGVTSAIDSSGRHYIYTYGAPYSGAPKDRLLNVTVTLEEATIGMVDYAYYDGTTTHGSAGDLKWVRISTPMSHGDDDTMVQVRYFRYYIEEEDPESSLGPPHAIKLELGFEGARKFDAAHSFTAFYDDSSVSDASLKSYSIAYLTYQPNNPGGGFRCRVTTAIFNGECGCGSGSIGTGLYAFSQGQASGYSTAIGNGSYDNGWMTRTIVTQPDGNFVIQYFDETGQPLSRIITTSAPPSSGTCNGWVTEVVRTSSSPGGLINEIHTPADNTNYTHSSGTFARSGTGLVHYFERIDGAESGWSVTSASDTVGFVKTVRYSQGAVGTPSTGAYCLSGTQYQTANFQVVSGTNVTRPFVQKRRAFKNATYTASSSSDYDETSYAYTFYSGTSTSILVITPETIETTLPTVATGNNGSGSADTVKPAVYLLKDGRTAFTRSADTVIGQTTYDSNRQIASRILDANVTSPPTGFSTTGTGLSYETAYTYDPQGRPQSVTLPSGRIMAYWYDQLGDHKRISYSIPKFVEDTDISLESGTSSGDVTISVTDHSCNVVWMGTAGLPDGGTSTPPLDWTVTVSGTLSPPTPPVSPFDIIIFRAPTPVAKLIRVQSRVYDDSGTHLLESHSYHTYDFATVTSGDGADVTNFDTTLIGYDEMGRVRRMRQPTSSTHKGTLTRTVFDALGRSTERWVGTNDYGDAGGETSGTNNMTKVERLVYDGGSSNYGNSLLTERTQDPDGDWTGTTTDQQVTSLTYDYRGRMLLQTNPLAPHTLNKYDNLGRLLAIAQYSSTGSITVGTTDPAATGTQSTRMTLVKSFYDERGRIFKNQRHKITQSNGNDADNLQSLTWYDPIGRVMKIRGEQLTKTKYDRLGRATHQFSLKTDNDANYAAAWDDTNKITDVSGNEVVEEAQTAYDDTYKTGNVLMRGTISRRHDDASTTGALDSNADGGTPSALKFTADNIKGRIQIAAMWYDDVDRMTHSVNYGTNGIVGNGSTTTGTFDRGGLALPDHDDGPLVTDYEYVVTDSSGSWYGGLMYQTRNPGPDTSPMVTRTTYDLAGRQLTVTRNYTGTGGALGTPSGDANQRLEYAYSDGLRISLTAKLESPAPDQTTTYIYGTTAATPSQMKLSVGHLLRAVKYPDTSNTGTTQADIASDSSDVVSYAYNALGQPVYTKDQAGNILENDYDKLGRATQRRATNIVSGFDNAVKRVATIYTDRGQLDKVTQYDNASAGSGAVTDELQFAYDEWGNLITFTQDPDSAIGGANRADYSVGYEYEKTTSGRNTLRRTKMKQSWTTNQIWYVYSDVSLDPFGYYVSRVPTISMAVDDGSGGWDLTPMVKYTYLGMGHLAGETLLEPSMYNKLYADATGTDPYPQLDQFNRQVKNRWTKDLSTDRDFYSVDIAYDVDSNISSVVDNIHRAGAFTTSSNGLFDAKYSMDGLNRLLEAKEGHLSGGSISPVTRDEQWKDGSGGLGLSLTGNWLFHRLDVNGNTAFNNAGDEDESAAATFNKANERTGRTYTVGGSPVVFAATYDAVGNLTATGTSTYKYDVFGRLREVHSTAGGTPLVAEYRYNGLGFRIADHTDVSSSGGPPDGTVNAYDPWYFHCYDESWRIVATFRDSDTYPKTWEIYHNAGLGGFGGSSYIDAMICRYRDTTNGWTGAADGTFEETRYYCQNWRGDTSLIVTDTGVPKEWVKYSAYGVPFCIKAGDANSDGVATAGGGTADYVAINGWITATSYDPRADLDGDGDVDATDLGLLSAETLGRGVQSRSDTDSRLGYAGYRWDAAIGKDHVRYRVYDPAWGRWMRRDPAGYRGGINLYGYAYDTPIINVDPSGLMSQNQPGARSDAQCCQDAITGGYDIPPHPGIPDEFAPPASAAGVICCDGRKVACVWQLIWVTPVTRPTPSMPGRKNGYDLVRGCVEAHETTHFGETKDCKSSPPLYRPPFKTNADECAAYKKEVSCYEAALKSCEAMTNQADRNECQNIVEIHMKDACTQSEGKYGCPPMTACNRFRPPPGPSLPLKIILPGNTEPTDMFPQVLVPATSCPSDRPKVFE